MNSAHYFAQILEFCNEYFSAENGIDVDSIDEIFRAVNAEAEAGLIQSAGEILDPIILESVRDVCESAGVQW